MIINRTLFYTTIGVIFEKISPLLISFIFINKIADEEYGLWIICFQFFLIFNSSIATPLTLNFNKNFFTSTNKKINITEARLIILIILLSFTVLLFVPNTSLLIAFLVTVMICCSVFSLLIFNYLRYSEQNLKYAIYSGIRFFLFLFCLISFGFDNQLEINEILQSFIISNSLPFIGFVKKIKITFKSKDFKNEFLKLSFYGVITFFLSGIDRATLGFYDYDLVSIATIGYAATIANVPSILTETLKKYLSPLFFKDFTLKGFFSDKTIKSTTVFFIGLTIIQLIFPIVFFLILKETGFVKNSLVTSDFISLIVVFSLSMAIYNSYHFLNPIIFYNNKSEKLIFILGLCSTMFLLLLKIPFEFLNPILKVAFLKLITSILLIIFTFKMVFNERK